jgi:predicted N-acyltransferase
MKVLACSKSQTALAESGREGGSAGEMPLTFEVYQTVASIPREDWESVVPVSEVCLRHAFLSGIESAGRAAMDFRYVLFYQDQRPVAFAMFQLIRFDVGKIGPYAQHTGESRNFLQEAGHAIARFAKDISRRFSVRMLVLGNAFLTGEHGFYHSPKIAPEQAFEALMDAVKHLRKSIGRVRAVVLKDFVPGPDHPEAFLVAQGYHLFHGDPNMILHLQPEWESFDHYLDAMASKYRQRARSAFKKSEGLVSREMSLEDILAVNGELFSLFCKIAEKDRFVLQQVPEKYFCTLKAEMGDQLKVTGYYHEDQLIAFMTHIPNGQLLEAHYIGYDPELNRELKIYQRMLYDTVRFAIDEGYACISLGRTAMEIKSTIGAEGQQMNMYVRMTQPLINRLARPVMRNLSMEEWIPRSPFRS